MNNPNQSILRFFRVMANGQCYLSMIYLLASFPLGVFYFVFLVSGLSLGISLVIIWVGIPILLIVGIVIWAWSSRRKEDFDKAARMALDDDKPVESNDLK